MANQDPNNTIDILPTSEYYSTLKKEILKAKPKSRILISAMSVEPEEKHIKALFAALKKAAIRESVIDIAFDAQSFMVNPKTMNHRVFYAPNHPRQYTYGVFSKLNKTIEDLEKYGIRVHITNIPKRYIIRPFSGRSHIKLAIVNNISYIGGCNLDGAKNSDYMARSTNAAQSKWLYDTLLPAYRNGHIGDNLHFTDQSFSPSKNLSVLLDSGAKSQSLIYDTALKLIDESTDWLVLTCQFFPQGKIADHLVAAHERGVNVRIIYNHPLRYTDIFGKSLHSFHKLWMKQRVPKEFFKDERPRNASYLHAKILATENGGIIGSHNFVSESVRLGTAELALYGNTPKFALKLRDSVKKLPK